MRRPRRAAPSVVLLSGGMDSATCLAIAARRGPVFALTVSYGQRHVRELRSARSLSRHYRVRRHAVLTIPLAPLVRSSLTDASAPLPSGGVVAGKIPSTYVPARNTILLALATAFAESHGADRIYFGANAIDYSGYPDCRPEFVRLFNRLARLATRAGVEGRPIRVVAPLQRASKAEIVRWGARLGVPWELTWSCYAGGAAPCGRCDSCRLRAEGFRAAGQTDPLGERSPTARRRPGSRRRTRS
ncbi:MAG: 7-cyano-7-deazaguanine synthase QueC [Thermoplasmata archaeon]|nr:7-cyano-7-deazaguanine synthase QueC [Thermoplasmata archaeon]